MTISKFFEFPGILITIGIALLLISIIIIIFAVRSDKKTDFKSQAIDTNDFQPADNPQVESPQIETPQEEIPQVETPQVENGVPEEVKAPEEMPRVAPQVVNNTPTSSDDEEIELL